MKINKKSILYKKFRNNLISFTLFNLFLVGCAVSQQSETLPSSISPEIVDSLPEDTRTEIKETISPAPTNETLTDSTEIDEAAPSEDDSEEVITKQPELDVISPESFGVTLEDLNLRSGAGIEYSVLTTLLRGQRLTILGNEDEWLKVQAGNNQGWVNSHWVKIVDAKTINGNAELNTLIASATSNYPIEQVARAQNVEIAAYRISGTLIQPGESFSFTQLVGPVNMSNGYQNATVFSNGNIAEGIGGGICQVSSTIYWAQLRAGILPTERKAHSRAVGYVPLGLDATMWEGSIDYRFINTLDYPIYLFVEANQGTLTVEFWSDAQALNNYSFEPRTVLIGSTESTQTYQTFLQTFESGELISDFFIDQSTYRIN